MCGISALIGRLAGAREALEAMNDQIRHRGPDDEGYAVFPGGDGDCVVSGGRDTPAELGRGPLRYQKFNPGRVDSLVALGHRRLSIVDTSALGHQPMCDAEARYWITYNGEIYNHIELRRQLEADGVSFASHSDTEVILQAYARWGAECLHRFNGMFAFVLYDRVRRRIFAARDRFGVKPMYFWRTPDGQVAFASEIKQFGALRGWRPALNVDAARDFLHWGIFDHDGATFFADVRQVRGGECIEADVDELVAGVTVRRWYDLPERTFEGSFEDAAITLRDILSDSVALRLRADVPVGSCLSGGLDSSTIVCMANAQLRAQPGSPGQNAFSARSELAALDEFRYMDTVVKHTGVSPHYVTPTGEDLLDTIGRMSWHQDEPFGSTGIYAQWKVFELASQTGLKVMLDGQGADELLCGYHSFMFARVGSLLRAGHWTTLWRELADIHETYGYPDFEPSRYFTQRARQATRTAAARSFKALPAPAQELIRALLPGVRARHRGRHCSEGSPSAANDVHPYLRNGGDWNDVARMAREQVLSTNLPMLLHWEDRNSMAHSIESRVPFLDYRLVEFGASLPVHYRVQGAATKRVLREAINGVVPDLIRKRTDKLGFSTPESDWLRGPAREWARAKLAASVEAARDLLPTDALPEFDAALEKPGGIDGRFWRMISFGLWIDRFNVRVS